MKIYVTNGVNTSADAGLVFQIQSIITRNLARDPEADYFQIFEVTKQCLENRQERPERTVKYRKLQGVKPTKLWAIRDDYPEGPIWTILYPDEY